MNCPFHNNPLKVRMIDVVVKNQDKCYVSPEEWENLKNREHSFLSKTTISIGRDIIHVCPRCAFAVREIRR